MRHVLCLLVSLFLFVIASGNATAQTELLQNGGFETIVNRKPPPWELQGNFAFAFDNAASLAHAGKGVVSLAGHTKASDLCFYRITLPSNVGSLRLSLFLKILQVGTPKGEDTFFVSIFDSNAKFIENLMVLTDKDEDNFFPYGLINLDMTKFKGQSIILVFAGECGDFTDTSFLIDDVSLKSSTGPGPDFSVSVTPASQSVQAGNTANYSLIVNNMNGFNSGLTVTFTGLPPGSSVPPFNSPSPTPFQVVTGVSTPPGAYNINVTGMGGGITHSTSFTLTVQPKSVGDFALLLSPSNQSISAGATSSFTVALQPINGFNGSVDLSGTFTPKDSTTTANFSNTTLSVGTTSSVTFTTTATTPSQVFTFNITGTSGQTVRTAVATITVNSGPFINAAAFDGKKVLSIIGNKFGSSAKVLLNASDVSKFIKGSTDTAITVKGKPAKLGIRSGQNTVTVVDSSGKVSNQVTFNF